ncbi:MAG: hypothetical protein PVH88_25150 [Ignavibacteria bacterium]|jgi:hypothetical protein
MKKEYDFSESVKGKFYHENVQINIPIYLDKDVAEFVEEISKKKEIDLQTIVNTMLRNNKDIIQTWQ